MLLRRNWRKNLRMLVYNLLCRLRVLKQIYGVFVLPHLLKNLFFLQVHLVEFHRIIKRLLNDPLDDRVVERRVILIVISHLRGVHEIGAGHFRHI